MGFSTLRLVLILALILILISCPSCAIKITAGTGDGSGRASVTGEYSLQNSAFLGTDITLGQGAVSRLSSARGNDENTIIESASGSCGSITNAVSSDGSFHSTNGDFASGEGAVSTYQASLAGSSGSISTTSTGNENEMVITGGFSGKGDLDVSLGASSGETAYVGGTVASAGVNLLDEDLSRQLASTDGKMSIDGLHVTEDAALGKFELKAVNQKGKPAPPSPPVTLTLNPMWLASDGDHPETTSNGGKPDSYAHTVWKIGDNPMQLYLRSDSNLAGEGLTATAGQAIITAAETWDYHTIKKELFANSILISSSVSADKGDGKSVHAFKPISGSAIAYARTYWDSSNTVVESDVCYNTRLGWTTTWGSTYPTVDLQSIALHELGHTVGMGDLYLPSIPEPAHSDWSQIMNSYDGPQHNLGEGDIMGLKLKYGA